MGSLLQQLRDVRGRNGAKAVLGLGVASVWLVLAAIVGVIAVDGADGTTVGTTGEGTALGPGVGSGSTLPGTVPGTAPGATVPGAPPVTAVDGADGTTVPAAPGASGTPGVAPVPGAAPAPGVAPAPGAPPAPVPQQPSKGDRTGVTDSQILIGIHAPKTFSGVPLNLAEDPIKGLEAYTKFLNDNGGINGRKLVLDIQDDRFDSQGARDSANTLINDHKVFAVSGTLGIDQVAIVAQEAQRRGVPYMAAGGSESEVIPGMFQISASYDTFVEKLAAFIASDSEYKGKRIGILVSDSQYIRPVAENFKRQLESRGQTVSVIVANKKPQENPSYDQYINEFRSSRTEVVVPLTDPLTTQQIVQRCAAGALCGWTYSFGNFAHDSDTALTLLTPTWGRQGVRGLSGSCYYLAPEVNGANCGNMKVARDQYIAVNGQDGWNADGSGAAAGYQIIGFLKGALSAPGADLTRERFTAALRSYSGYSDLVTGPITFAGSTNIMHGVEKMVVLQAQPNDKYKMVTPGFVDGF